MFHFSELPLRKLFFYLDGTTAGPNAFTGTLGKALIFCQLLDITRFKKIDGDASNNRLPEFE